MMNTPSMYSVDQLLKARQNGVPDYVVVPMLQKAMAQKQAMAQQQALQQGMNPPPPVADQILDAAHNDVMQEHMARRSREEMTPVPSSRKEARGIDVLPSGIDESDYAHGGIIAFARGGSSEVGEDDLVTLPDIVKKRNNLLGQSREVDGEWVPKDYPDVAANVMDGKDLLARKYSQFDNPDDVITQWRGKGAKNLPIYKENVRNWLKESGWKEGDKLNLKDDKDLDRMVAAIANQEMSAHLKPEHISAITSGKYKFADGAPASSSNQRVAQQSAPPQGNPTGGIASLAYPSAPEEQQQPYTQEETTPEYEGKRLQDYLGEDPNAAKREARLAKREADLSEEKDRSPWMAMMQAGLSTMAGTSPNAFANIGAGASEGLRAYGEARKDLSKSEDKLMDLRGEVEDAQYAHEQAIKMKGLESADAKRKENLLTKKENKANRYAHDVNEAKFKLDEFKAVADANKENAYAEYLSGAKQTNAENAAELRKEQALETKLKNVDTAVARDKKVWLDSFKTTGEQPTQEQIDAYELKLRNAYLEQHGLPKIATPTIQRAGVADPSQFDRSLNR